MKKQTLQIIILLLVAIGVAGVIVRPWRHARTVSLPFPSANMRQTPQDFVDQEGLNAFKKKYYQSQIATYQMILKSAPNSMETKKKLAFAYFEAGEFDKSKPLLEEVSKSPLADDAVRKKLEQMGHVVH